MSKRTTKYSDFKSEPVLQSSRIVVTPVHFCLNFPYSSIIIEKNGERFTVYPSDSLASLNPISFSVDGIDGLITLLDSWFADHDVIHIEEADDVV